MSAELRLNLDAISPHPTTHKGSRTMALFPCSKCGCVEDTALCHFWSARLRQMPTVCSACDPTIGKWHGEFPREPARHWTYDERGFLLWNRKEVEDWLGRPIEIIGKPSSSRSPNLYGR